jgi:hypothetical protein
MTQPVPKYFRKVIHIAAEDSPNVQLAMRQKALGREPTHDEITPGLLTYPEYLMRRKTWDKVRQCIGLDGRFYRGGEVLLYPPDWLNFGEEMGRALEGKKRVARAMGIDPGEGGDPTAWAIVDEYGLIYLQSFPTPDTSIIPGETLRLIKAWDIPDDRVVFDRGGGGKEHADILRDQDYDVRSVGFGEAIAIEPKAAMRRIRERRMIKEEKGTYVNRRAQLFGEMSMMFNPDVPRTHAFADHVSEVGPPVERFMAIKGFAIPPENHNAMETYAEFRRQLSPIPRWTDKEGRLYLPAKKRKGEEEYQELFTGMTERRRVPTLIDLIGRSPDEADAVALAIHGMIHKSHVMSIGNALA